MKRVISLSRLETTSGEYQLRKDIFYDDNGHKLAGYVKELT